MKVAMIIVMKAIVTVEGATPPCQRCFSQFAHVETRGKTETFVECQKARTFGRPGDAGRVVGWGGVGWGGVGWGV